MRRCRIIFEDANIEGGKVQLVVPGRASTFFSFNGATMIVAP